MKWSWKVGAIAGIAVYIHATFLVLIGWVVLLHWRQDQRLFDTLLGVAFVLLIFVCVVLHELGHAMAARKFGIMTRDITLLPIGGVARLERMPEDPRQELWVALAGPAVNIVIAGGLLLVLQITTGVGSLSGAELGHGPFFQRLMLVNVFLVVFNMLPAFPMDGGRVVRALLATRMEYTRATEIAASLGQGMSFLFGFLGFFTNPFLIFIALFVWIGAEQESSMVQMKTALGGIPVSEAMITEFHTLSPRDSLGRAIELTLAGSQQDFPVTEAGSVVGILKRDDLFVALAQRDPDTLVREVMQRDFQVTDASDMLASVFARLQSGGCSTLPALRRGKVVGLVTMENIGEFIAIQSALNVAKRKRNQ